MLDTTISRRYFDLFSYFFFSRISGFYVSWKMSAKKKKKKNKKQKKKKKDKTIGMKYQSILWGTSRKHAYIILTPLNPLLYSKTGVYRGIHYFFYSAKNIVCGYSLEPPRRGGSNEYPQSMFWAGIWKVSDFFLEFSFFDCKVFNIHVIE